MPSIQWNAKAYDEKHSFVSRFGSDLIGWLDPKPNESILDLGCGTGQLAYEISECGASVLGIDSSAAMIEKARYNFPRMNFQLGDARQLHFHEKFDAVFSNATLHWIQEQEKVIAGVRESLKQGGRFVFELGGKHNVKSITDAIVQARSRLGIKQALADAYWFFPGIPEYATLLEKLELTVTQMYYFERQTPLVGEDGMKNWMLMFGDFLFENMSEHQKHAVLDEAVEILRPQRYVEGVWYADYMRLRGIAKKK